MDTVPAPAGSGAEPSAVIGPESVATFAAQVAFRASFRGESTAEQRLIWAIAHRTRFET